MKKLKLKVILILLSINLVLVNQTVSSSDNSNSEQYEQISSLLPEDIVFTYNSSFCSQELSFETSIQLDRFNNFILLFATSGDKTNGEGIKVTLSLEKVEVVCIIERLFQDTLNHNITQAFSYPEAVDGKMNVTITCEAQTSSSYYSGSLRIFSQTEAEKILPPTITESSSSLPVVPNWLRFKVGLTSSEIRSVTTAFNNFNNFDKLNLTISFRASDFSAYLHQFEVQVNENIVSTKDFENNQLMEETFFFSINPGLNFLTINFIVGFCVDEIQLTNICLIGNGINIESILPVNTYAWLAWENIDVNYVFDLSSFKPVSIGLEQILQIDIQYGCIGTAIFPAIFYEIKLGAKVLNSGEISETEQINSPQTLLVQSQVTNYHDPLTFRIQGRAQGYGIFYILNTTYVAIEPLPELTEQNPLVRELVETEVHHTPLSEPLVLTYRDYFKTNLYYLKCNVSLLFSLTDEFGSSIRQIDILMKLNWQTVIDHPITYEDQINVTESEILYNKMYDVTITLSIYGDGQTITLSNLKYILLPSNSYNITIPEPPTPPVESNSDREPIHPSKLSLLYIEYGIIFLGLTLLIVRILSNREEKQESIEGETQVDDLEIQIVGHNTQYGHLSKLLQSTKEWYLKAKESLSRMLLLPLTVVQVITNIICLSIIIDRLNEIASREIQEVKLIVLGTVGFYCLMVSVYSSTLVAFSAFYLAFSDTFYEDFFRFTKFLGIFILFLFFSSWVTLFIYIQQNSPNLGILGTLSVTFILLSIIILLVWLGKTKEKQFERLVKNFFKSGRIKVRNIRWDDTEINSMIEEEPLSSIEYNNHFQKIVNLVIQDISIKLQVPVNRFSELLSISSRLAHRLLIDVSNKIPKLGEYYITEQIYVRSADSEIGVDILENITEEKKGELISKYDNNGVNNEKTRNNNRKENRNNVKIAEDFTGNQAKSSQKTHQITLSRKYDIELTRHTELYMREVDGAFLRHHDIENEYDLIKKRIKKLPKSFYSKCIYKVFEEGVLGRINSEISVAHFLRILDVRAARDGSASLLELGAVGKKFLENYSRIAEQIKEDWGDKSALVMILKSYRDMVLGTFRKFNDKQLNIWKGYLADAEVISNIYTKVDWANQYLHMRLIEEISDVSNYEDICSFANQIWEEEIQDIFVEMACYGEIIPVTGYKVREIEIHSSMIWMDHMTTQNGILKFDIDKLLIDKKGYLDGRGPITLDIDQLGKNNVAINITSPEDTIKLFIERPGVDWNTYNIDAEFKIIDREKFTPSEARSLFSGVKYVKHSFVDFLKKGALVNYFYDDSTKTLLDVEKRSLSYIESTIARRIYAEKGLHRIINSWVPTKYTIDGYNGIEGRLQIKKAVKLASSCAADDGIIPRLNFINCDSDLLKNNILRFERIYLTDKTIAGSIPFNIGKFSFGKFIIDVPQGFHISINTEVLKECLLLSKFQEKKGINLSSSNVEIETAFQALIPQTTRRGVRGVFFIINDNGKFKPFVSSFKEIFYELYANQLYFNIPIKSRKNLFDVYISDETGTSDCIGNGVMIQSNENGDIINIIHHDFDSYISTVSNAQHTGQRIFISASTYNEITKYGIRDRHGDKWESYYITLRGTTFENNQIKKNVEIPDQILIELHRGLLPCFNPTSSSEIPAKVLRMKRVLLQSVLTTGTVPIISYQRGYQVRYIWVPLENAITHLTTQLKDVGHDSVLPISDREEMISNLYDFLREVGALHNCNIQSKQLHLIEKLEDTIKYYIKLQSYPKIDVYCQIIETLGHPDVKELSFDPLFSGFLFFTMLQERVVRDLFQSQNYSLDRLFNGYFQQTPTRKIVQGGDGYYLRHHAIYGKYPARGYNFYRTNAIDSIDIFRNCLLTDIELMQKRFSNFGETTESIIDLLTSQFKIGLKSKPTIYPLRADYLKETYKKLFGFIHQNELINYIQRIDKISAMKIHTSDKRQAFDEFSTYLSNLLNTDETLSNLMKEKMLGIIEYNEPKTSDDKIKIRLIFMDTTTEFKSYMRDSVGNQMITTWESSNLFSTLGENPLINLYRFQIFVKELGGRIIYDKKNSGAKILWIDEDSSLFLNPLMEELGQEKVSTYRGLFDIFGNAIGKELSGVKAQKNPHVRFIKHTEITDNIWFKAIPMIAFFEMKYYSVYSVEERLNKLGIDTSLRNNYGFLENSYVGAAIKYIQFDLTEVKTGEWCVQLISGNYKGSEGFGTPLGNRIAETIMPMRAFTPFAVFTDSITSGTDFSSVSILDDEIERAIINLNKPTDDYEYTNSKDKGQYDNKENKIWSMRILNRLVAIWGGGSFEY